MISEYSSNFNLKLNEIETLKVKLDNKDDLFKEKDKKFKELETKMKDMELRYREKEENEDKYKVKVDRYREKEDRYRVKEDKFKEKEKKFEEKEEKFVELEKRLKDKERKFKENEEKLRQKEDEMFRVYELVNQLQLRMKSDKINPIVNGHDILSIGKSKPKNLTEVKDDDEDICILSSPENLPAPQKAIVAIIPKEKEPVSKATVIDPRQERKVNDNDPRQNKVTEDREILNTTESGNSLKTSQLSAAAVQFNLSALKTSTHSSKPTLVKSSDLRGTLDTCISSELDLSSSKHRLLSSKREERKNEFSDSSRRSSGNSRQADDFLDS